jgi:hypothetical protein
MGFIMKNVRMVFLGMMLLVLVFPFATAAENNVSKLIVQGEGKVIAAPDKVTVVLGVETRDSSAAIAASDNAQLMNETIAALIAAVIAEKEIQTSSYSLRTASQDEPVLAGTRQKAPEFLASNLVTVNLNNTTDVGRVLDAAVSAGSNTIQEVSFDLKDSQPQQDLALTMAIEDARRKAEVAAEAAGLNLGKVLEISEGYGYVSAKSQSAVFDMATPIQPGQMEITASVTMTYEIS